MPAYGQVQDDFGGDPFASLSAREKQLAAKRLFLMKKASEAAQVSSPGGQYTPKIDGQPQWYVPPSFLQMAAPLAGQVTNLVQRRALEKEQQAFDADDKSAASAVMNSMPAPRTQDKARPSPDFRGPMPEETVKPTREENLKWASQGMQVPSLRKQLEKFYDDQLTNEPVRQERRAERQEDREDRQADMSVRQKLEYEFKQKELEQRAADAKQRSEDARLSIQQRQEAAQQHNELMRQMAADRNATARDIASSRADAARGKMSDKARSDLDAYNASATGLDQAISSLEKASDKGTGYLAGLVADKVPGGGALVAQRRDKSTNDAVQQLTYWTDAIRHDRFGSALTATEKSSASQYLPNEYDDLEALKRKAAGIRNLIDLNHKRLRTQYGTEAVGGQSGGAAGSWDSGNQPAAAETKTVGGKKYVKRNGQWYEQ